MNCPFCAQLMDLFRRLRPIHPDINTTELGKISDIIEMPCPHADSIRRLWERGLALCGRMDGDLEKNSPQGWTVDTENNSRMTLTLRFYLDGRYKFHLVISLVSRPDKPGHPGETRVLSPQWISPSIPCAWYDECLEEHGQRCQQPTWMRLRPEPIAMPEWLVDVVDNCVVPYGSICRAFIHLGWRSMPEAYQHNYRATEGKGFLKPRPSTGNSPDCSGSF